MIERRRPLPAGRYWIDVFPKNKPRWEAYVAVMAQLGALGVEVTEHVPGIDGAPDHDFVIFQTDRELVWPDSEMGFAPNVATSEVHSSDDTVQKPPPSDPIGDVQQLGKELVRGIVTAGVVAGGLLVVVSLLSLRRRRTRRA